MIDPARKPVEAPPMQSQQMKPATTHYIQSVHGWYLSYFPVLALPQVKHCITLTVGFRFTNLGFVFLFLH